MNRGIERVKERKEMKDRETRNKKGRQKLMRTEMESEKDAELER